MNASMTAYEVTFRGEAGDLLAAAFEGSRLTRTDGLTTVHCTLSDAAAIHAVIDRVFSLGLELVEVHQLPPTA